MIRPGREHDLAQLLALSKALHDESDAFREISIDTAKLTGVLRTFLPCLLVPAAHLVYASAIGVVSPFAVPLVVVAGAISLGAWATFGLSQSLDQPTPDGAVRRTMGAPGCRGRPCDGSSARRRSSPACARPTR